MPSTVNGIGTWYYGKDRLVTRRGQCEFCRAYEELKSYDTTLYFVVLFIPILPLRRKRIIDECPRCKRHRAARLSEWESRKADSILTATQAWQQDRGNPAKATDALGTAIGFHDVESFHQLAQPVGEAFARDADVQIFLGDAYDHFGDAEPAERCYRAAVVNQPGEKTQESLAKFYLRQIRPAEAEPLLSHILSNRVRAKAMLLMAVAEAYQAVGDHERAWRIVDDVGTTFPDLLSDPHYEKIRRSVSRNRGTNRIVRSTDMKRDDGFKQTNWLQRHMGLAIVGTVVLVAAAWYLILAFSLGKHTVHLVNGTAAQYTADINGSRFTLPPMSSTPADLREGTLKISVPDSSAPIAPAAIEMHTNFWRRPWNRRTMVINPDRSAVVVWETTRYSESPSPAQADMPRPRLYIGEVFYDLDKADYVFQDFPSRISLGEDKVVTKTRVGMAKDETEVIAAVASQLPPKGQIDFLRRHLADRPLRLQFHRFYQGLVQVEEPEYDLGGEYRALSKNNPQDPQLTYLLARVVDDRDEAIRLFTQAADAPRPCAYADYALAFDAMNAGNFPEALKRANTADALEAGNVAFLEARVNALEALGQYDDALTALKSAEKHDMDDAPLVGSEVRLLATKGDLDAAKKRIDGYCKELSITMPDAGQIDTHIRLPMEAVLHYAAGDMAAYRAAMAARTSPDAAFAGSITDGKLDAAQSALSQMKSTTTSDYLILYIAARRANKNSIAKSAWQGALDLMNKDRRDERLFAKAISGADPPSAKALRNWTAMPLDRSIMLTALGLRFPNEQSDYFAAARMLNFSKRFPYHLISETVATTNAKP